MPATPNPRLVFASIPTGIPIPGQTVVHDSSQSIDLDAVVLNGGVLRKLVVFSIDPYMRNRMRPVESPGDMPAFPLGETMNGHGVAVILKSETQSLPVGSHLYGFMPFQKYTVIQSMDKHAENLAQLGLRKIENPLNLSWTKYVGGAGMPGQTAFFGLKRVSEPKAGETLYVSAASGAVGQLVVQFAKKLGLKVIASAGSTEKCDYVRSLGADHVFNYKESRVGDELKTHGPIDIYFDHVGGETLEAAIDNCAMGARILICGAISTYNVDFKDAYGVKNLWLVNRKRITIKAMTVIDWEAEYGEEFYDTVPKMLASGELKYREHIYNGIKEAPQGLSDLFTGKNFGKAVVVMED